jgi:hypothetical protein
VEGPDEAAADGEPARPRRHGVARATTLFVAASIRTTSPQKSQLTQTASPAARAVSMNPHATNGSPQLGKAVVGATAAIAAVVAPVVGSTRETVPSAVLGTQIDPAAAAGAPGCGGTAIGRPATRVGGVRGARTTIRTETSRLSLPPLATARTRSTCLPTASASE